MSETTPTSTAAAPPPKRRRRFRWYTRLALVFVFLIVAIVVIAQLLFWSDVPRRIVQAQIGNILHVEARLGSLKIGWLGDVAVRDLTLRMPTEDAPFLDVKRADLKLPPLPMIAFDQELRAIRVDGVDLQLRQLANGRWNLQQLVASAAGPSSEPSRPTDPARVLSQLPDARLANARVTVTQADGRRLVLPDIAASLDASSPLSKTFAATVGTDIKADGKVAVLGSAPHEATVVVTRPPAGLGAFLGAELPEPIRASLHWTGRLTRGGVVGTLGIDDVTASLLNVAGRAAVNANADGALVVRPVGLTLRADADATTRPTTAAATTATTTQPAGPIVVAVNAGQIRVDDRVRVERLRGTVNGDGKFAVDGLLDPTTLAGTLSAAWEDVARAGLIATGHLDVRTERLFTGKLRLDAGAGATVRLPGGEAVGTLVVDGEGAALDAFEANLTIEPFQWTPAGKAAVVGPALYGNVVARGDAIDLTSLRTTDPAVGSMLARAHVARSTWTWWATLDARQLKLAPLEAQGVRGPVDANVAAYGDRDVYVVQHLYGRLGPASAWATGAYRRTEPKPLRLDTWAWLERPAAGEARMAGLTAQGVVGGTLGGPIEETRRDIQAALDVRADDLVVQGRAIGDVDIRIDASVTDDRVQVASREMELLGGSFALNAYRDLTNAAAPYVATLDLKAIPVARLGELVRQPGLQGAIDDGHVQVVVPASLERLDEVTATATVRGSRLAAPPLRAESLTVAASLKDGEFRAVPILREGEGRLEAELVADVRFERPATLHFELADWPAPAPLAATRPTTAATDESATTTQPTVRSRGNARGDVAVTRRPDGKLDATLALDAGVDRAGERIADVSIEATARDKVLLLKRAFVQTLDGMLNATGGVDLANVNGAELTATFHRLAPATLAWYNPMIAEVRGRYDGTFTVAPAKGVRPLGPLEVVLAVRPTPDAGFRSVSLGDVDARGFVDFESAQKYRLVTDRAEIHVAGGVVRPFGRFTYDAAVGPSQLVTVRFDRLDIDQLTRVVKDDGKPLTGRLAGTLRMYGPARSLDAVTGEAAVQITESDLANFGPVAALYNIMNIGAAGKEPTGTGDVSARVEAGTLTLLDATYFNRGVFANAFGSVRELGKLPDSPLDLTIVGSAQPLKQAGRGVFADVFGTANDAFAALQTSLTAIRATNTLKEPKVAQVGLSDLGSDIKSVLIGKSK